MILYFRLNSSRESTASYVMYALDQSRLLYTCEKVYCLYPHGQDDRVIVIYQRDKSPSTRGRGSFKPILEWFVIIFIASIMLHAVRVIGRQHFNRIVGNYPISFIDSLAVFLGNSLAIFGTRRAERWFLVSLSVFGLIFRAIYTDSLFVMFTDTNQDRLTTIDQLILSKFKVETSTGAWDLADDLRLKMRK